MDALFSTPGCLRARRCALAALATFIVVAVVAPPADAATSLPKKTYTQDDTWEAAESPYVVEGDQTVAQGVTLTIEPGVVVKLKGQPRSINVYGKLRALGASGRRIVFTSFEDDATGGSVDGFASVGLRGQWGRIFVTGAASSAELNHVTLRYGGYACCSYPYTYGVLFAHDGAKVTATQALLEHNYHYAVRAVTSCTTSASCAPEVSLESSVLYDNKGGVSTTNGVGHLRKSVVLANDLRGAYYALVTAYRGPASEVMDSDVQDNGEEGVYLSVDETSLAQVPTEHWPRGNRNNIWGNNAATATSPVQLWGQKPRRAVNWKQNFWGWDTAFGENSQDCVDAGYPGRLRYPTQGEDPDDPSPDGVGPIRGKYDLVTANGLTASCYFDYYDGGGPSEFAKNPYVFREGGPSPEINPYNDLLDLLRTFGSCALLQHAVTPIVCQGDPVQSATGNFTDSAVDLALPGIGVPFEFERAYNSLDDRDGPLGRGWTHGYDIGLGIASNGDVTFRGEYGQRLEFPKQPDGSYGDRAGVRSKLEKITDGYKLTRPDQVVYGFDNAGNLTSLRDRNGQGLAFTHTNGNLTGITDSAGRAITLSYNAAGKLAEVALPDTRKVTYGYTSGLLTSVTDARGKTTTYTYDTGQRLATEVDPNNHTVFANTYASDGRVTEQVDALGKKTTFSWDPATETATATDARGNQWKDVYSNRVLVARVDPLGNTTSYGYDADFNLVSETDPRGNTTTTTYDAQGNVLKRTAPAPLSYEEAFTYNARNDVTSAIDARGNATTFGYDTAGNLTSTTEPGNGGAGFTTTFGRDPAGTGLLKSVTDPRGKTTSFGHDAAGNLTSVTSPGGSVETMGYDQSGRMTSRVSPRGNVQGASPDDYKTTYTYNATDGLTGVTNPLGHVWSFGYDDVGNRTSQTDPKNRATTWTYDAANRLASVTAPDNAATAYGYDAIGNMTSRTDAKNHTTTWTYDAANRLQSEVSPTSDSYAYGYDKAGNLTQVIDANGNATTGDTTDGITTYSYDALNRLTAVGYSDATPDVSFAYDGNGNRTQMTDVAGTQTYSYDERNNLASVTRGTDVFAYTYDPAGNLASRTYPGGRATSYGYDDDGQLTTAASDGATTSYGYDKDGNLTRIELPSGNGHVETRTYDRAGRLTELVSAKSGTTLFSSTYAYDEVGNPTALQTSDGPINYTYDAQDRITEACYATTCSGPSDPFIRYAYDDVGNRTSETRPSGTTTYSYDAADRLTQKGDGTTTTSYTFDKNGNQTAAGQRTFSYDLAGRLKSTTDNGVTETYSYDGDGKRLTASTGTGAADTTKYLWDVTHPNAQLAIERDGNGDPLRAYTYGLGRIAMHTAGNPFYYHHDQIGSVTNLTSASGAKQRSYSYEPFGAARASVQDDPNAPGNPIRFAGEQHDATTGLYHLRARQYDPTDGRFLATDPLPHPVSDPYVSTYHYAKNRPGVLIDPSGMGSVWTDDDEGNSFCSSIQILCDAKDWAANRVGDATHELDRKAITALHATYLGLSAIAIAEGCVASVALGPAAPAGCGAVAGADLAFTDWLYSKDAFDGSYLPHEPNLFEDGAD